MQGTMLYIMVRYNEDDKTEFVRHEDNSIVVFDREEDAQTFLSNRDDRDECDVIKFPGPTLNWWRE